MVPRGPTIRKRLSPNSTTTVAAYIITGIHIYAWNTQDSDGEGGEKQGGRKKKQKKKQKKKVQSEECEGERERLALVRLS